MYGHILVTWCQVDDVSQILPDHKIKFHGQAVQPVF